MKKMFHNRSRAGFVQLLFFRFPIVYFLLYILYDLLSRFGSSINYSFKYFDALVEFIGVDFYGLHKNFSVHSGGVVDSAFHYISILIIVFISFLIAFIWTLLLKRNRDWEKHHYLFILFLRSYIGFILISYGLVKIFFLQFPEPSLLRLVQSYGNSSPMGLAWTFFGYSQGYNVFIGFAEILSVLLLFRRTLTIGLIITFFVCVNVMMVNIFYDIPLKINAVHLVLIVVYLLSSDFKSLYSFFIKGNKSSLQYNFVQPQIFKGKVTGVLISSIKIAFILIILITASFKLIKRNSILNGEFTKSKFYGIYEVVSLTKNNDLRMFSIDELGATWKYLVMEHRGRTDIVNFNREISHYRTQIDSTSNLIELRNFNKPSDTFQIKYQMTQEDKVILKMKYQLDSLTMVCNILNKEDFLLINRGFHLINEEGFNK